jgi:hypothetical protein
MRYKSLHMLYAVLRYESLKRVMTRIMTHVVIRVMIRIMTRVMAHIQGCYMVLQNLSISYQNLSKF